MASGASHQIRLNKSRTGVNVDLAVQSCTLMLQALGLAKDLIKRNSEMDAKRKGSQPPSKSWREQPRDSCAELGKQSIKLRTERIR